LVQKAEIIPLRSSHRKQTSLYQCTVAAAVVLLIPQVFVAVASNYRQDEAGAASAWDSIFKRPLGHAFTPCPHASPALLLRQMTQDEIFTKIRGVLVDALAVDGDDVTRKSVLTADLGAESIDFLDIVFKLEQVFAIKIPQGELFPENLAQDPRYVQSGKLTPEGLTLLKGRLPHVDFSSFEADPVLKKVGSLFTVETLIKFVEFKLAKK